MRRWRLSLMFCHTLDLLSVLLKWKPLLPQPPTYDKSFCHHALNRKASLPLHFLNSWTCLLPRPTLFPPQTKSSSFLVKVSVNNTSLLWGTHTIKIETAFYPIKLFVHTSCHSFITPPLSLMIPIVYCQRNHRWTLEWRLQRIFYLKVL